MHIFYSVQYDLYFLFNVKLLTTHSTDVAATNNSKNKFCPFAKALLHYFSNTKKHRESKERKVNFRSSVYGSSRACRCWPLNFFLVIDKGKNDIFMETASAREEEKKKTVENRMQEKRKALKTTSNKCIVFVSETR